MTTQELEFDFSTASSAMWVDGDVEAKMIIKKHGDRTTTIMVHVEDKYITLEVEALAKIRVLESSKEFVLAGMKL